MLRIKKKQKQKTVFNKIKKKIMKKENLEIKHLYFVYCCTKNKNKTGKKMQVQKQKRKVIKSKMCVAF